MFTKVLHNAFGIILSDCNSYKERLRFSHKDFRELYLFILGGMPQQNFKQALKKILNFNSRTTSSPYDLMFYSKRFKTIK